VFDCVIIIFFFSTQIINISDKEKTFYHNCKKNKKTEEITSKIKIRNS
jgi:hypothetical protein